MVSSWRPDLFQRHLPDSILVDNFPSSAAFDAISDALSTDAERKDAVKQGGSIFAFNLKNKESQEQAWYIDLKESGKVGKGAAPEGKKADGKLD